MKSLRKDLEDWNNVFNKGDGMDIYWILYLNWKYDFLCAYGSSIKTNHVLDHKKI